jgi:group I intron endonuclease
MSKNILKSPSNFHAEKEEDLYKTGIYCIYFKHNKAKYYVGSAGIKHNLVKSANGFWCRWRLHLWNLEKNQHHSKYLQNVYNKYGKDSIYFKILEIVEDLDILITREQFWINILDSYKTGYNCTAIAGTRLGTKVGNNLWGKAVVQFSLQGQKLNEYITTREAFRQTGFSYKVIHKCCIGKAIQYKEYIWRFKGDSFDKFNIKPLIDVSKKIVRQYDIHNNFIKEYSTITEASKNTNITLSNISMCLRGQRKKAGGFIWKQVNK